MAETVVRCFYNFDEEMRARLRAVSPRLAITFSPPDGQAHVDDLDDPEVEVLLSKYCPRDPRRVPRLRWLAVPGAGIDHLGSTDRWGRGLTVTNGSGLFAVPMAEYVLAAMLFFSQRTSFRLLAQEQRSWPVPWEDTWLRLLGSRLRGRTITVVGYGSVGREVARLASAFGMTILAVKARPDQRRDTGYAWPGVGDPDGTIPQQVVGMRDMKECLARSDYVVLTLPSTAATARSIDADAIAALPPHAVLVNVARGSVMDEQALFDALKQGRVRGAALDVLTVEPVPADDPAWTVPNLLLTPHLSGISDPREVSIELVDLLCENLRRYSAGDPLLNVVDGARGY